MPGFDRTGPEGQGSRTGRALGKCNPKSRNVENDLSNEDFIPGRGLRFGPGRGLGRGSGRRVGRGLGRGYGNGQNKGRS